MTWHLFAVAAAAAVIAAPAPEAPPIAAGEPDEILELERERYRRMTVPVTIGSEGPFRFMIDTGAQATVISSALATRLALLDRQTATLVGMASIRSVETTSIPDFGLGSRSFHIQTAAVVDGANIGGADGILGLDSLQTQRVLIDFKNMEMAVADADQLGGNRGFEIIVQARRRLGQLIITSAKVDGVTTVVLVDTGAQGTVGNPALMNKLRRSRPLGDTTLTDINGVVMAGPVRLAGELQMGRASINNLPILFADSPTFRRLDLIEQPALVLGMEQLKLFRRVAIDFQTQKILFDLPTQATASNFVRFGT